MDPRGQAPGSQHLLDPLVNRVRSEHDNRTLDVVDGPPLVHLAGAYPKEMPPVEGVFGEVDGVGGRPAPDGEEQVEVQALRGQELPRTTTIADAFQGVQ